MLPRLQVEQAFVVSDVHIRHSDDEISRRFRRFLRERVAPEPGAHLIIAGDLLHFWFGRRNSVPPEFRELVADLEALGRVTWLEGNHDLRLKRALGRGSRIQVVEGALLVDHLGSSLHIEHGHRVDREDRGQLLLDGLLQTPLADLGGFLLTERGTQRLGLWAATHSSGEGAYDGRDPKWLEAARRFARERASSGAELTLLGHGHYLGWWPEGLVCLGDWLHWNSYLELCPDGTRRLRRFDSQLSEDRVLAESPLDEIPR